MKRVPPSVQYLWLSVSKMSPCYKRRNHCLGISGRNIDAICLDLMYNKTVDKCSEVFWRMRINMCAPKISECVLSYHKQRISDKTTPMLLVDICLFLFPLKTRSRSRKIARFLFGKLTRNAVLRADIWSPLFWLLQLFIE